MVIRVLLVLCMLFGLSVVGIACSQQAAPYFDNPYYSHTDRYSNTDRRPVNRTRCDGSQRNCEEDERRNEDDDDDHRDRDTSSDECDHNNPDLSIPDCTLWSDGATARLTQTSNFEDFADVMSLNTDHIANIQINLALSKVGGNTKSLYGGDIRLGFYNEYDDEINEAEGEASTNASQIPYNHWVTHDKNNNRRIDVDNGEHYIKLFFEIEGGALIVVAYPRGDNYALTGEVFFKEFDRRRCSVTNTWPWFGCGAAPYFTGGSHCWVLPAGLHDFEHGAGFNVHDCRAFVVDLTRDGGRHARVDTSSIIHPGATTQGRYISIGHFENLVPSDAGITLPFSTD